MARSNPKFLSAAQINKSAPLMDPAKSSALDLLESEFASIKSDISNLISEPGNSISAIQNLTSELTGLKEELFNKKLKSSDYKTDGLKTTNKATKLALEYENMKKDADKLQNIGAMLKAKAKNMMLDAEELEIEAESLKIELESLDVEILKQSPIVENSTDELKPAIFQEPKLALEPKAIFGVILPSEAKRSPIRIDIHSSQFGY